jgi:hypothetical protein
MPKNAKKLPHVPRKRPKYPSNAPTAYKSFRNAYYAQKNAGIFRLALAEGGHLDVLQWAREHGCPWDKQVAACAAGASTRPLLTSTPTFLN